MEPAAKSENLIISLPKPKHSAEAIFKPYELFIYGNIS
jgi:hypothetical protein